MSSPLHRPGRRMPLRVPQADAVSWLRAGALGLGCVLLGVVAVSMLLSPAPAPAGDLAADSSVLSDRRDLHREAAVGSLGGDGRASTTKSRDRDIAMLVLNDHAAFRRWFALMDEAQAQADAEEEAETKKAAEGAANEEEEQKKGSEKNEKKKTNNGLAKLESIWNALTLHLEIHAQAEEKLLYPTLVRKGGEEAGAETKDAIGDHNKIRDAIGASRNHSVGSSEWWKAVHDARVENTDHMGEEEDEALPDFRLHTSKETRERLGDKWKAFFKAHPKGKGLELDTDIDPDEYVKKYEAKRKRDEEKTAAAEEAK